MKQLRAFFCLALGGLLLGGCASYHYFIVEPATLAQQISKKPVQLQRDPVTYQFSERDKRLAIGVSNPTTNALAINEKQSFVVDPDGQTHPLKTGTIAPKSYITLLLPPEANVIRARPAFGFGVGFGHGGYPLSSFGTYEPFYGPHDYYYYDEHESSFWRWKDGPVRLRLSLESQGGETNSLQQDWTFERRKIK